MDTAAAIARIDQTLRDIESYGSAFTIWDSDSDRRRLELDQAISEGMSVARAICAATPGHVNAQGLGPKYAAITADRWIPATHALRQLRAGLGASAEAAAIVGPKGPSLTAEQLHPAVWSAAIHLWSDGHYRAAVQAAATAVDLKGASALGVDLHGSDLFNQAFSLDPPKTNRPRLRFLDIPSEEGARWKSQHNGARGVSAGAMELVRNETTHNLAELDAPIALEYLAVLSLVARMIDRGTVQTSVDV